MRAVSSLLNLAVMLLVVSATCPLFSGCAQPVTEVKGVVTLDGNPLPGATLEFFPVSGQGKVSFTHTDENGRYRVDVSPTKLVVVVTATKVVGKSKNPFDPNGPPVDVFGRALPERFTHRDTTPLTADPVQNTSTTIDFAIDSAAK